MFSGALPPPCRQQQGAGGYSVGEACLLARSSLPQQRVLALRLLCAVLARARPRPCGPPGGGPVPLPADVAAQLAQELQQAQTLSQPEQQLAGAQPQPAAPRPDWLAVWHHALHSADITPLLRRSLDDQHVAVAAAAAEALAALLGAAGPAGTAEEAAAEAADASPLTGLPAPPLRHLQARVPCCPPDGHSAQLCARPKTQCTALRASAAALFLNATSASAAAAVAFGCPQSRPARHTCLLHLPCKTANISADPLRSGRLPAAPGWLPPLHPMPSAGRAPRAMNRLARRRRSLWTRSSCPRWTLCLVRRLLPGPSQVLAGA